MRRYPKYLYDIWRKMNCRCHDQKDAGYPAYGARGIYVCERWRHSFEAFAIDMGERPTQAHSIDRIDNKSGYGPQNCRWATPSEQNENRSNTRLLTYLGKTQSLGRWAKEIGVSVSALHYRIVRMKLDVAVALTVPLKRGNRRGNFQL